jgi:serine-type D-Ala-D-Ala endopeptidase (penicillin-binding protein 7)
MKILIALLLVVNTAWARNEPSLLLFNTTTGHTLISQNIQEQRPLASITKLMTALVALDTGYALERPVPLNRRWSTVLPARSYTRGELMTTMLVRSDNSASETLAGDYPGGRDEFIREMNDRARRLGMLNTQFEDASGLSANNISTANDIAILVKEALKQDYLRKTTVIKHTEIEVPGKKRPIKIQINNTNSPLLGAHDSAVLSKTGLTSKAGWCVAMAFEQEGQQYIVVVLGAKNKQERTKMVERTLATR